MVGKILSETDVEIELQYLRFRNKNLAKALTDEKLVNKQCLDEKYKVQQKLHHTMLMNLRYKELINQIKCCSNNMLANILSLSEDVTKIVTLAKVAQDISDNEVDYESCKKVCNTPTNVPNKTRVVQPMISGHVIFRPTINLRRLSDSFPPTQYINTSINGQEDLQTDVTDNNLSHDINWNPIPGLDPHALLDEENEENELSDNSLVDSCDEDDSPEENAITNGTEQSSVISRQELSVIAESEEDAEIVDIEMISPMRSSILKEARVMISPLPHRMSNNDTPVVSELNDQTTLISLPSSTPHINSNSITYDPLEGPSTLLDDVEVFEKYYKKRKSSTVTPDPSDSENEDWTPLYVVKRRKQTKSKSIRKTDKVIATNEAHDEQINQQPVVLLTQLNQNDLGKLHSTDEVKSSSSPATKSNDAECSNIDLCLSETSERRSRRARATPGSMKEISLRKKLRRER